MGTDKFIPAGTPLNWIRSKTGFVRCVAATDIMVRETETRRDVWPAAAHDGALLIVDMRNATGAHPSKLLVTRQTPYTIGA